MCTGSKLLRRFPSWYPKHCYLSWCITDVMSMQAWLLKPDRSRVRKVSGLLRIPVNRAQFQSTSRGPSPENRPVYNGFRFKGVRFKQSRLYIHHSFNHWSGLVRSRSRQRDNFASTRYHLSTFKRFEGSKHDRNMYIGVETVFNTLVRRAVRPLSSSWRTGGEARALRQIGFVSGPWELRRKAPQANHTPISWRCSTWLPWLSLLQMYVLLLPNAWCWSF